MKIRVLSLANIVLSFVLALSVSACGGGNDELDPPSTSGKEEEQEPSEGVNGDPENEAVISVYSDQTDAYFRNDVNASDEVRLSGEGGKSADWLSVAEYERSGSVFKYLRISENMTRGDRCADAVIYRSGQKVFTYHVKQSHKDFYGYDPADWEIIGSGNVYRSLVGGSSAALWNNRNLTLLDGAQIAMGTGLMGERYLYSCAIAKGKDYQSVIYKDGVQEMVMENCNATSMAVRGFSLYVGGTWSENREEYPAYWKDGVMVDLSEGKTLEGYVACIAVDGNDVYVGGADYMWKNGRRIEMDRAGYASSFVSGIVVDGSDVYACGYLIKEDDVFTACWWQNGTLHLLDTDGAKGNSAAGAILRHDGKTYIGGYVNAYRAAIWTDGELKRLTAYNGNVNVLAARGKDEIFAGGAKEGKPVVWRVRSRYAGEVAELYMNTSVDGAESDEMYGNVTGLIVCPKR